MTDGLAFKLLIQFNQWDFESVLCDHVLNRSWLRLAGLVDSLDTESIAVLFLQVRCVKLQGLDGVGSQI